MVLMADLLKHLLGWGLPPARAGFAECRTWAGLASGELPEGIRPASAIIPKRPQDRECVMILADAASYRAP
jgi:hypothetical protein